MLFWSGIAMGGFCGVLVVVALGFMLRGALDCFELPRAAEDDYSAVDADYGASFVVRRDGGATRNVTYWERARTIRAGNNGHE